MLDLQRLGDALREARTAAGLTQQELAARAGVSLSYISMLEKGQRNVTLSTLDSIAQALGRQLTISIDPPMTPHQNDLLSRLRDRIPSLDPAFLVTLDVLIRGWEGVPSSTDCQENVKAS